MLSDKPQARAILGKSSPDLSVPINFSESARSQTVHATAENDWQLVIVDRSLERLQLGKLLGMDAATAAIDAYRSRAVH